MRTFTYYYNVPDKNGMLTVQSVELTRDEFRRIVHIDPVTREVC